MRILRTDLRILRSDGVREPLEGKASEHTDVVRGRFLKLVPNEQIVQSVEFARPWLRPAGERCVDLNTDAIGFMGNVVAPIRITDAKNWRPYATAWLGMIRSWVTDPSNTVADSNQNNFAFNFGGGVMYSLNNRVGLRGDVRYFRALVNGDGFYFNDYGFLRATFGVTFGFPR